MTKTLVCLHGWGGSKDSFTELREELKGSGIHIIAPDLPGFGSAPEPPEPWTVDDYANWAESFIRETVRGPYALLGHSHGGRIAIKLASRWASRLCTAPAPSHLFLCAAAGISRTHSMRRTAGFFLAKIGKTILILPGLRSLQETGKKWLYKIMRVHDYERASKNMRRTLLLVSQENLRPLLHRIRIPTTIFWGENDRMTPLADGQLMRKRIPGSTLHAFANTRHGVHRDRATEIAATIRRTLGNRE